ncbi:TetR/AcrR family transcriptional regulator [Azospirillum rugosum]|uniref:AcrR family transcriptional regulator n=1 Tax=Azospirillum rugosum TaxID=416170 RepID=A0ABS4SZ57_9PROT|nr:TetR/AcrR family transcriptional regulator [Azospirillum rugosum]MBP2297247.1 AcrR family transcriptional regulator [Azospirillum rugosum]MDQ0531089.1 AcrR family transcriptional regulator [Azospirillum rugosum]
MQIADTRISILETAARLYADLGYSAVSMRDVATAVGVTPANLYHHFKGKDELVREAVAHVFAQKTAPIADLLDAQGEGTDRLKFFVDYFVRLLTDDWVFFRLLVRELVDGDEKRLNDLARSVLERPFRSVSGLAGQGQSADERFMATISTIAVILGHVLLSGLLPHLPGASPDHSTPTAIAMHISTMLRRAFQSNAKD